jgi:hypothetical protein
VRRSEKKKITKFSVASQEFQSYNKRHKSERRRQFKKKTQQS